MADDNSLFDKIIEMGMGMTIASQIPNMLNGAVQGQNTAQTAPPQMQISFQIYAGINNSQAGPFSEQEFILLIQKGLVTGNTLVWKPGMTNWMPASQVPEASRLLLLYSELSIRG